MKNKLILLGCSFIFSIASVLAQTRSVSGTVYSEIDGEPMIGATLQVKGTTIATITDINGKFTLSNVPESSQTLVVSYVGMETQEIAIKPSLTIYMRENVRMMDEVLVVAFGEQKKSSFTGSAGVLKTETLEKRQVSNVVEALTGQIPGVQIIQSSGSPSAGDDKTQIRIRGISSINASNEPLFILDGMPYDGGWSNINPADVESVTVLKDAASNALYGARGANGVIMITTKKAKAGEAVVTLDAKWGANTKAARRYDYITEPGKYYEQHYLALYNYYNRGSQLGAYEAHRRANETLSLPAGDGGLGYMVYKVPDGQYLIGENGRLNPNATLGNIVNYNGLDYLLTPDNWEDEAFRVSLRQEYNVSISSGSEKTQFYASFGYLNDQGIVYGSDYERYATRLRASHQAKSWLKVGGNISFNHYTSNGVSEDSSTTLFGHVNRIAPIYPVYIRNGQGEFMTDDNGIRYDYGNFDNAGLSRPVLPNTNPLQTNTLNTSNNSANSLNAQGFVDINFLKDFKFTFNAGVSNHERRWTVTSQPFYGYISSLGGSVDKYHYRDYSFNMQQLLNYSRNFGEHTVTGLIGHENYLHEYAYLFASRSNMFSFFENQELNGAITLKDAKSYVRNYNTEGYFVRGQYDYSNKYFLSASYRRDASSRFHPDHRWGNFWSLGGAWILNEEDWFQIDPVDFLKFKISYGSQGNDKIGNFRYVDQYTIEDSDGSISLVFDTKGNKNITWETNASFNTGFEFELFKRRLNGSIEYFQRETKDMLTWFTTPLSLGYSGYYDNIGNMTNKGVELDLNGDIVRTRNINWSVNMNLTHVKNKLTYLAEERKANEQEGYFGYNSGSYFYGEGLPLYSWRTRKYAGVNDEGLPLWYYEDDNGELQTTSVYSNADYYLCGSALPTVYGGFGTKFSLYGFDLNISFSYSLGGKAYDSEYASLMGVPTAGSTGSNIHKDMLNAWSEENRDSDIPRWQFGDTNITSHSDRFLTNASWLQLQNINIGYTLPRKAIKPLYLNSVRIYLACDNVYYWSKRKGFDPRYNINGSTSSTTYSPIRRISGGINIQF